MFCGFKGVSRKSTTRYKRSAKGKLSSDHKKVWRTAYPQFHLSIFMLFIMSFSELILLKLKKKSFRIAFTQNSHKNLTKTREDNESFRVHSYGYRSISILISCFMDFSVFYNFTDAAKNCDFFPHQKNLECFFSTLKKSIPIKGGIVYKEIIIFKQLCIGLILSCRYIYIKKGKIISNPEKQNCQLAIYSSVEHSPPICVGI